MKKGIIISATAVIAILLIGIAIPKLTVHDLVQVDPSLKQCALYGARMSLNNPLERAALWLGKSAIVSQNGSNDVGVESFTLFRIPLGILRGQPGVKIGVSCDFAGGPATAVASQILDGFYRNDTFGFTLAYDPSRFPRLKIFNNDISPIVYSPTGGRPSFELHLYDDPKLFRNTLYDPGQSDKDAEEYEILTYSTVDRQWVITYKSEKTLCPMERYTKQGVPYYGIATSQHTGDYYNVYVTDKGLVAVVGGYATVDGVWTPEDIVFDDPASVHTAICRPMLQ